MLAIHLPQLKSQIQHLQELTKMIILKADLIWRERAEVNVGYLSLFTSPQGICSSLDQLISAAESCLWSIIFSRRD